MGNTSERLLTQCLGQLPSGMGQGDIAVRAQRAMLGAPSFTPVGQEQMWPCLSHLLAPVPRAGQPAQSTPTSPAWHSMHRHQARQPVLPQACIAGVPTEVPVGLSHLHLQLLGQAEPKTWQARQEDPSLPHLLGFALFYSFFPSSRSLPLSSLLQGSRKSNQSLEEHHHLLLLTEEHTDLPGS